MYATNMHWLLGEAFSCFDTLQQRVTDEQTHFPRYTRALHMNRAIKINKQKNFTFILRSELLIDMAYL